MDELMKTAMQRIEAAKKSSLPWTPDQPHPQPYYSFNDGSSTWEPRHPGTPKDTDTDTGTGTGEFSRLALFSWNIDFMLPHADERMIAALAHLETLVLPILSSPSSSSSSSSSSPSPTAVVVFLQECVPSDLRILSETPWVRSHFHLSDLDAENWTSGHYGTAVLVDRRLPVAAAAGLFRVHYAQTRMERDAFFVDVLMVLAERRSRGGKKLIRLCNTHLESLALDPPLRPAQVKLFAGYMHGGGDGGDTGTTTAETGGAGGKPQPHGAVAAGDFNAIQDFDRALHADNGLRDAFLELGGREDTGAAFTWGQQAATGLRKLYGCSRMDKVYFCGGLKLLRFERFGADVQLDGEGYAKEFDALDFEKPWVTDHLGVTATFDVVD
ncbi:putative endonuclease exonuclease phosphatase family protein [Eutypa lata UCREL1]|uniref:Putative endonuclease exonuclease phosphatase family protein n=1 Tax=Eutypa lata (strain UCR-EL1) TaxID=1287681 RepID=M7T206_EUTLA|nr:putative endonuclease exonuclease phosphatase family protein [Eutypa lata UCREL1]